jgi:protein TonB
LKRHLLGEKVLQTLLESRSKKVRSTGGAIASVVAHSALIGTALYATARAGDRTAKVPEPYEHVVVFPATAPTQTTTASHSHRAPANPLPRPRLVYTPISVDVKLPTIDMTAMLPTAGDFSPTQFSKLGANNGAASSTPGSDRAFDAGQVERQVSLVPGTLPPRYPETLRAAGVEGQVIALFVVDERGCVEDASIRFAHAGNTLFEDAVRVALRRMHFTPAEFGGRKVRQLVQMPFVFTLAR